MRQSYVLEAFVREPWAILPERLAILDEIVMRHVSGEKLSADEVQSRLHGALKRPEERKETSPQPLPKGGGATVAVLPLFGTIFPRGNLMTQMSGATSAEMFGKRFDELLGDAEIDAIVLDVDSPGGQVGGIEEVSRKIYDGRGRKPIVAVANHLMASAAYWIGSAADELVVTPSGEVGSIGVFAVHKDYSKALEMEGIKYTVISEGKYKVEGNPYEPLSEEARGAIQTNVHEVYEVFVADVARNRGVAVESVREGFGEGRVVSSRQALELGMADRIDTMEGVITNLGMRMVNLAKIKAMRSEAEVLRVQVHEILNQTGG